MAEGGLPRQERYLRVQRFVYSFVIPTIRMRNKMKLSKYLLPTIGATVFLSVLVGGASARNFSVSNQVFRTSFRALTFRAVFGDIVCEVRLSGSLHARTFVKRVGSLIGYITQATLGPCAAGQATILQALLPWHVRYLGFTGALPNITTIIMNTDTHFRVRNAVITCLFESAAERSAILTFNRDVARRTLTTATRGGTIPSDCGQEGTLGSDAAPVTLLNTTTVITVTLI